MLSLKLLFFHFSLEIATVIILSISDRYSFHFNPFIYWFQVLSKNEKEYSGLFGIYRKRKDWVGYFQLFTVVIVFSSSFIERFFFLCCFPENLSFLQSPITFKIYLEHAMILPGQLSLKFHPVHVHIQR